MRARTPPTIDESIERDEATENDLRDVFRMLLQHTPKPPPSENREPTREELKRKWKLERSA